MYGNLSQWCSIGNYLITRYGGDIEGLWKRRRKMASFSSNGSTICFSNGLMSVESSDIVEFIAESIEFIQIYPTI